MEKFNVVRPKKFTKDGEEKTMWLQVGTITKFDNGGSILEMNHMSETFQIFPFKEKKEKEVKIEELGKDVTNEEPMPQDMGF